MNKTFLTAASALAIMVAAPAFADTEIKTETSTEIKAERTENKGGMAEYSSEEVSKNVKEGWEGTKKAVSDAAESVSDAAENTYKDIKAAFISNDKDAKISDVVINQRMTASGMIGQPVYDASENRIAKVKDIILDKNGDAVMVVMGDGDFTGLGKTVAFDYNVITKRSAEGDIISPLTEAMIDSAAEFSYESNVKTESVKMIPQNGYSVARLMDAKLMDGKGEHIADIDNISFSNGEADKLIVGFNKILGLGGKQAALDFGNVDKVKNDNEIDFRLSTNQSVQFENYKKTAVN